MNRQHEATVVVVGAGPTGLLLTHLLATYGVPTILIDQAESTVGEARAVSIDDESLRTVQAAGMLERTITNITQGYGVDYYSWRGKLFARIDPTACENGWQKRNAFRQHVFVRQLCDGLTHHPHVRVLFRHELTSFDQSAAGVVLKIKANGRLEEFKCQWLVACDGGRSATREALGISLSGNTFAERWLIADLVGRASSYRHTRTYCDPVRPCIRLPGPDGTVRYEFMLHKGEGLNQSIDEKVVRAWIGHREPADAKLEIARNVIYTFHARIADRWRQGRIFLAGDAAHLTPPFAGQGMNSGIRDAANLAWKLAAVIQGHLPESLLETYEQERKPHAWSLIQMALQIGRFMQPKSKIGAAFSQTALRLICLWRPARDYITQLRFKPKPRFKRGFFKRAKESEQDFVAGQLLPQPRVDLQDGRSIALDEVLGTGFSIIQIAGSPPVSLPPGLPGRHIDVIRRSQDFLPSMKAREICVRDRDDVLGPILDAARASAIVIRPDRYIYAFVPRGAEAGIIDMTESRH